PSSPSGIRQFRSNDPSVKRMTSDCLSKGRCLSVCRGAVPPGHEKTIALARYRILSELSATQGSDQGGRPCRWSRHHWPNHGIPFETSRSKRRGHRPKHDRWRRNISYNCPYHVCDRRAASRIGFEAGETG